MLIPPFYHLNQALRAYEMDSKPIAMMDVTPGIITIAKYYFSENKTIDPGLILEPRVNW